VPLDTLDIDTPTSHSFATAATSTQHVLVFQSASFSEPVLLTH
jgi:hypothetical protein